MHDNLMEIMWSTGHLSGSNAEYVEGLYEQYLSEPSSIPQQRRDFFQSLPAANGSNAQEVSHAEIKQDFEA